MFKTDIIDKAKSLEEQANSFVEDTKQLLLEENMRENGLLFAAGMNGAHIERVRLDQEGAMRKQLRMKTGTQAVLPLEEIRQLCILYRLRFLPSKYYSGAIDALTGRKLAAFLDKNGDPNPARSAETRLYIMAPADVFKLNVHQPVPPDPVLFYRHDDGLYSVVHKWGNDMTIFRRILGFFTSTALVWRWSMFLGIIAVTTILGLFFYLMGWQDPAEITILLGFIFAPVRAASASAENNEGRYFFSDRCWNEETRQSRHPFWM